MLSRPGFSKQFFLAALVLIGIAGSFAQPPEEEILQEVIYTLNVNTSDKCSTVTQGGIIVVCGAEGEPIFRQDENWGTGIFCTRVTPPDEENGSEPSVALWCNSLPSNSHSTIFRCAGTTPEARTVVYAGLAEGSVEGCSDAYFTEVNLHRTCAVDHGNNDSSSVPTQELVTGLDCRNVTDLTSYPSVSGTSCTSLASNLNGYPVGATTSDQAIPESCVWDSNSFAEEIVAFDDAATMTNYTISFQYDDDNVNCGSFEAGSMTFSCGDGGRLVYPSESYVAHKCAHATNQQVCSFQVLDVFDINDDEIVLSCIGPTPKALSLRVDWLPSFDCSPQGPSLQQRYHVGIRQRCPGDSTPFGLDSVPNECTSAYMDPEVYDSRRAFYCEIEGPMPEMATAQLGPDRLDGTCFVVGNLDDNDSASGADCRGWANMVWFAASALVILVSL